MPSRQHRDHEGVGVPADLTALPLEDPAVDGEAPVFSCAYRGDGLGLGLFIVKAIANAHGGGLEVNSSNGATLFRLVLPRHTRTLRAADWVGGNVSSHR